MIGIIGAMEAEVNMLRSALEDVGAETIGAYEFFTGTLEIMASPKLREGSIPPAEPVLITRLGW